MTTFADLMVRVRQQLMGYAKDQSAIAELAVSMAGGDVTFTVSPDTVTSISSGLVEIDEELLLVKSFDRTSGQVTLLGGLNGRGAEGTTPAAHAVQALVTADPRFPKMRIKEAINDTIRALSPGLVAFGSTDIVNSSVVYEYGMPAEATDAWVVSDQTVGPTQVWMQGTRWKFITKAPTSAFPTGKSIQLFDAITPGRTMHVVYTKDPSPLVNLADEWVATTGLPERCADLPIWGACARLLPSYEAARLQQSSIESTERAPLVPPRAAAQAAQYFQMMFDKRLAEERAAMFEQVPQTQYYGS